MKLIKKIVDGEEVFFVGDVKKYSHFKDSNSFEWWTEYDEKGNEIHFKNSNGYEWWKEYDAKGKEIYFKDSDGFELWQRREKNPHKNAEEVDVEPFTFGKRKIIKK